MRFRPVEIVVVVVGFACVLLACEQIIGLDNFKKCAPLGNEVCDASLDGDVDADLDASDAGDAIDAFVFPDGVSEASSWARWRMDNTALEVQNGAPDASQFAFDGSVPPELLDTVTGLRWVQGPVGHAPNVTAAAAYCSGLGYRLPTRIEIVTLLDSTQQKAPFIATPFVSFVQPNESLWTSSYVRPIPQSGLTFWFADLSGGDMKISIPSNVGVLCVR